MPGPEARIHAPSVTSAIRLLMVEDSRADCLLAERHLRQAGMGLETRRVDSLAGLLEALAGPAWDAVLSDYSVPGLPFRETLRAVQAACPDLPILLFSGSIGEEEAIALMKEGVRDFVLKDRPARLALSLQNALEDAWLRRSQRQASEALVASEARYMSTFERAAVGIAQVGLDGRILRANRRLGEILGYPPWELPGKSTLELSHPEYAQATLERQAGLLAGEAGAFAQEKVDIRRDGSEVWVSISESLVRDAQGLPEYFIVVVEDIQARKDAEAALVAAEARSAAMFEQAAVGIAQVTLDGRILRANQRHCEIFGYGREEMTGMSGQVLSHPDDLPATRLQMDRMLAGEIPGFTQEKRVLRKDGSSAWASVAMSLVRDAGGRPDYIITVAEDISARRQAEAERRSSEARFAAMFQAAPLALLLTRLEDEVVLAANPAYQALTGLDWAALAGRTTLEAGVWDDPRVRDGVWAKLRAGEPIWGLEADFRRADGALRRVVLFTEVADLDGERILVNMFQDVTEVRAAQVREREMERELNHLQRLESVGRLAGGVAHDMNNVLAAIMALAETQQASPWIPPEILKMARSIQFAATRGRDLVKSLTQFSRKDLPDAAPLDLNDLVRREADLMARTTFRRILVQADLHEPLPEIRGEASALANVLMNLCVNACDAMPGGGELRLETRVLADGRVQLAVADTGQGMPPDVAARALEPFFTTKAPGKGTGLGLSIVFGTVRAHGGTLEIHSRPGQGTRVEMAFPACAPGPPAPAAAEPAPGGDAALDVLLVDDDELIQHSVPLMLESLGHRAQVAPGGPEALGLLERGLEPDLVVLDLNMPGMDGLATLERLRALRPDLPVLIATGNLDADTPARLARTPRLGFLAKPFNLAELRAALAALPKT